MRFFCFNVIFITFCLVCEVISDYSELMLPSKDHRTMRLNMRVGKRFGDSVYDDDEAPKTHIRHIIRVGKRFLIPEQNTLSQFQYDTDPTDSHTEDTLIEVPQDINKRELPNPKRRLRLVFRPGKRNFGNPEQTQFYTNPHQGETLEESSIKDINEREFPIAKRQLRMVFRHGKRDIGNPEQAKFYSNPYQGESVEESSIKAPKRRLRVQFRTGKRSSNLNEQHNTSTPQSQIYTEPQYDELSELSELFTRR